MVSNMMIMPGDVLSRWMHISVIIKYTLAASLKQYFEGSFSFKL
jgi:hypothetical protein